MVEFSDTAYGTPYRHIGYLTAMLTVFITATKLSILSILTMSYD